MAVYENGKALPGTERRPRPKAAVLKVRKVRASWTKGRKAAINKNGSARF